MSVTKIMVNDRSPHTEDLFGDADCFEPLSVVIGLEGLALGGCPINALDLGRALRDRGHRVSVFAIDENVRTSLIPYAEQCGLSVTVLPATTSLVSRSWQIRRFAERNSADVVHVFAPWLGAAASVAAATRRRSLVMVTNWMMENVSYTPKKIPMILGTPALQEQAQLTHQSRVWLMEPPVDLEGEATGCAAATSFRHENGIEDGEILAVIVSRLDSHMKAEGIVNAVRAVGQVESRSLRLVIVGDGNAFDTISLVAETVNTELGRKAVVMAGMRYDPRPAYSAADITLGMGGSALRCLAHKKPLIVLGENGFARTFEPSSEDFFMTEGFYGDQQVHEPVGHLAEQLLRLLDGSVRKELGEFGHARVRARFGLDVSVEKLERIYRTEIAQTPQLARRVESSFYILARNFAHHARRNTSRILHHLYSVRKAATFPNHQQS